MCGLSRCSCFGGYGGTEAPPPPPPLPPPSRSPPPLPASTARATERWWLACDEDRATEENSRLERERGFRRTPLVTGVRLATRARRFESLDTLEEEKRERVRKRGVERGSTDGMVGRISQGKRAGEGGENLVGTKVEERRPVMSGGGRRTRVSSTTQLAPAVPDSHLRVFLPALGLPHPSYAKTYEAEDPRGRECVGDTRGNTKLFQGERLSIRV